MSNWIERWRAQGRSSSVGNMPEGPERQRWLVVDVETSGLDARSDQLLAIAAIALEMDPRRRTLSVVLGDSFEVVLQPETVSDRQNIQVHGIGERQQRNGLAPDVALSQFIAFAANAPMLGFHSAFDRTVIERTCQAYLASVPSWHWLDLADLCRVACEEAPARSLDEWLAWFAIPCARRHQASADALVTAELLLRIWPRMLREGVEWPDLVRLAARRRWLSAS